MGVTNDIIEDDGEAIYDDTIGLQPELWAVHYSTLYYSTLYLYIVHYTVYLHYSTHYTTCLCTSIIIM